MEIVKFVPKPSEDEQGKLDILEVLDSLRKSVENGEICGVVCIGISPAKELFRWQAFKSLSNIELLGMLEYYKASVLRKDK